MYLHIMRQRYNFIKLPARTKQYILR